MEDKPSKADIELIFKRLRGITSNKVSIYKGLKQFYCKSSENDYIQEFDIN